MTTVASQPSQPRPQTQSALFKFVAEHNPFYLLSAFCMLGGCVALTNEKTWQPITFAQLLTLIATLNVYEFALIGIAVFLIRRRGLMRDGRMLLVLQAVFLVDVTFLGSEIVHFGGGPAASIVLFGLTLAKFFIVLAMLRPRLPWHQTVFVVIQLAALFALPNVFHRFDEARISPLHFYVAWIIVGLLPAVHELLAWTNRRPVPLVSGAAALSVPVRVYLALPWVSLFLHLGILHYVYHDIDYYGADAAPVLLGLALVINRVMPGPIASRRDLLVLRVLLPLAAIFVSLNNPAPLRFTLGPGWEITPPMLAFAGAYLTYVYCFLLPYALYFLAAGAVAGLLWIFGPTVSQVLNGIRATGRWSWDQGQKLIPSTIQEWGLLAVAAAFGFLAIGFAISLKKAPDDSGPAPAPVPNPAPLGDPRPDVATADERK